MFRKFEFHKGTETTILSIAHLDETIANIIDSVSNEQGIIYARTVKHSNTFADADNGCAASDDIGV